MKWAFGKTNIGKYDDIKFWFDEMTTWRMKATENLLIDKTSFAKMTSWRNDRGTSMASSTTNVLAT